MVHSPAEAVLTSPDIGVALRALPVFIHLDLDFYPQAG